jgi:PTS system glucose-specific IIC component
MDLVNFIWVSVLFAVLMYFIANFMIKKFNLATAGRNGNYDTETTDVVSNSNVDTANANSQVVQIINLLGGRDNIEEVDACMTRLRVSVKDVAQVGDENAWKQAGAMGLIIKDSGVQAVYGPKADVLKSDIQDLLESGVAIPRTEVVSTNTATSETKFKGITEAVYSVADGQAVSITEVKDPVFAQKMMGDGYAVEPVNGNVYAPVSGTVTSVFPTKHAVGILSDQGVEVLVHVGLDTVALNGAPFSTKVADGQHVQAGDLLLVADLDAIRSADRETTIVVAFTNSAEIKSVSLVNLGQVSKDSQVAIVEL